MNASTKLALILATAAFALPQTGMARSPALSKQWSGTWQLNTDKSKFSAPDTSTKSDTRTYTVVGNRVTMKSTMVNAAGKTIKWSYSAAVDGKSYRVTGNPNTDHIRLTRISDREIKSQSTLHGKPAVRATANLSTNGKVLTIHRSILTAKGGPSDDTAVYERTK